MPNKVSRWRENQENEQDSISSLFGGNTCGKQHFASILAIYLAHRWTLHTPLACGAALGPSSASPNSYNLHRPPHKFYSQWCSGNAPRRTTTGGNRTKCPGPGYSNGTSGKIKRSRASKESWRGQKLESQEKSKLTQQQGGFVFSSRWIQWVICSIILYFVELAII